MDIDKNVIKDLIESDTYNNLACFLNRLEFLISPEIGVEITNADTSNVLDKDYFKEVTEFCQYKAVLSFGKTLKDIKCLISDNNFREHVIWIHYNGPKKFCIRDLALPQSHIQDQEYKSIDDIVNVVKKHVDELSNYFEELCQIDQCCTVIEPVRPTFKENYRKIYLADKIWLHVEVSPDGSAKNLRILGQFDQRELQELLQAWDHNKDIATNALMIKSSLNRDGVAEINETVTIPDCAICYCVELPGDTRVPQPLCSNAKCGAYYHTSCLYEWLVACAGGRTPQFGVGKCPRCSQYIQCSDRDIQEQL